MEMSFGLELHLLTQTRMNIVTTVTVDGTLVVMIQYYFQDLLTSNVKTMGQGKKKGNTFTQETVWEL